eukprot:Partr_v1_DN28383_c2_g1_i1_m78396 putative Proline dehydrogenase
MLRLSLRCNFLIPQPPPLYNSCRNRFISSSRPVSKPPTQKYHRYKFPSATQFMALSTAIAAPLALSPSISTPAPAPSIVQHREEPEMFLRQNPSTAFAGRSFGSLLRSWLIFKACQFEWLVSAAPGIIAACQSVHLSWPVFQVVKRSFFAQFCGGETSVEVRPVMQRLKQSGIGSILDLSVESDAGDQSHVVVSERARIQNVMDLVADCITTAAYQPGTFVAIKVTALGSSHSLRVTAGVLTFARELFMANANADGRVSLDGFRVVLDNLPGQQSPSDIEHCRQLFGLADRHGRGEVSWNEFNHVLGLRKMPALYVGQIRPASCDLLIQKSGKCSVSEKYLPAVTPEDIREVSETTDRLAKLCELAVANNVKLMFDAEQSYFQSAIDHIALLMMHRFNSVSDGNNSGNTCIYNTYQLYLKDGLHRLINDHKHATFSTDPEDRFVFGAKLVRGAYMTSERERAHILNIKSPVNDSIEETHAAYDTAVQHLLSHGTKSRPVALCIASHNRQSIAKACAYLSDTPSDDRCVDLSFAQLYGMHDHTSFTLAANGYTVYKYVPYGPVADVIPYLLRRAQENRSILAGPGASGHLSDMNLIWMEMKKRVMGLFSFVD